MTDSVYCNLCQKWISKNQLGCSAIPMKLDCPLTIVAGMQPNPKLSPDSEIKVPEGTHPETHWTHIRDGYPTDLGMYIVHSPVKHSYRVYNITQEAQLQYMPEWFDEQGQTSWAALTPA
jgi:hypothetical protein